MKTGNNKDASMRTYVAMQQKYMRTYCIYTCMHKKKEGGLCNIMNSKYI